jgi:hypothetical protein
MVSGWLQGGWRDRERMSAKHRTAILTDKNGIPLEGRSAPSDDRSSTIGALGGGKLPTNVIATSLN